VQRSCTNSAVSPPSPVPRDKEFDLHIYLFITSLFAFRLSASNSVLIHLIRQLEKLDDSEEPTPNHKPFLLISGFQSTEAIVGQYIPHHEFPRHHIKPVASRSRSIVPVGDCSTSVDQQTPTRCSACPTTLSSPTNIGSIYPSKILLAW